jgi:hypothetical protein
MVPDVMSRRPSTPLVSPLPVSFGHGLASSFALRVVVGLVVVLVLLITGAGPPV